MGGVDILVHNAGVGNTRLTEDLTAKEWHHVIGVNLDSCFYTCKAVIPSMRSWGGGKIVLISSQAARAMTRQSCIAYTSSKSAILGFTRHLAFEVGPYKINVNTVLPGATLTPKVKVPPEEIQSTKDCHAAKGHVYASGYCRCRALSRFEQSPDDYRSRSRCGCWRISG